MGFANVKEYAAADELGQCWFTGFRKTVASAATTTNAWVDYSYFPGSPPANFYASAPSIAALIEADKGLKVPSVSPKTQHLKKFNVMTANTGNTANARQRLILCDYLLYYPFIDTDAIGEEQVMDNTVTIPRYTSGYVIAVAQSASSTIGNFTMNYTNQSGVAGQISQPINTFVVAGGGQVVSAGGVGASYNPFIPLALGDSGVQSIQSVTFTAAGGGLMALVIVKPLFNGYVTQECRTTSGVAFGAADEFQTIINSAGAPQIKDGAVLNFFAEGTQGSLATSQLVGFIETHWG
jgi:hypothetical protein